MSQLLKILIKFHRTFLFILLEIICFVLIIQNNHFQRSVYMSSANIVSGKIFEISSAVNSFINLKTVNDKLIKENTALRNQNDFLKLKADSLILFTDSTYIYRSAHIVNISVNRLDNTITINKGSIDGIKKEMGVMCCQGAVGIVSNVSKHFATVIPIINQNWSISAKIKRNNFFGSLWWDGKDYDKALLKDIPFHAEVFKGDTIITSGYSSIFPEGLSIGTVSDFSHENGNNFLSIKVKLTTNYKELDNVYVIENKYKAEKKLLESKKEND